MDEVLAQICEKYSSCFCIIFVLLRFEIFDHCIHSVNSSKEAKKVISPVTKTNKQRKVSEFGQERLQISPISEKENNDNFDQYLDRDNITLGRRSSSKSCL